MNNDKETGQQKYRNKMKEAGKRQRVFYLSVEAIEALKKRKIEDEKASLNAVIESLALAKPVVQIAAPAAAVAPRIEIKEVIKEVEKVVYQASAGERRIIAQAEEVARLFNIWNADKTNKNAISWGKSCAELAELI